jgi:uncharacterized protein YdeI (YjbR/CyaY-like superfamily)
VAEGNAGVADDSSWLRADRSIEVEQTLLHVSGKKRHYNNSVTIIIPLKESCALMFCKGALLKDARRILTKPGENTQAGRWIKFTSAREIVGMKAVLKAYIGEAISAEKAGLEVKYKKTAEFVIPPEFQNKLDEIPALKTAFAALTPGRQRFYLIYFSAAKQTKTRELRVKKCLPQILKGKGLNDP